MDDNRTISITLPADLLEGLDEAVRAGEFASRDEAVRVGIETLEADRIVQHLGIGRVRDMWRAGIESGHSAAGEVFRALEAKYRGIAADRSK